MILEKTVDLVKNIFQVHKKIPPKITNVVIGLGYTGVEVSAYAYKPFLGLASTLTNIISNNDCNKFNFAGKLTKFSVVELINWSYKEHGLKKIIGVATLNAVSQYILKIITPYQKVESDISQFLNIDKNKNIIFIGLIKPLIREIGKVSNQITIIEDSISISPEFRKFKNLHDINQLENDELITDVLFCTGSSLINNTLESILEKFKRRAQKIIVIGPTASLIPDILFDYGVDMVSGMEIFDSRAAIKVVQEGGGTKLFKKYGKKYNLIKD